MRERRKDVVWFPSTNGYATHSARAMTPGVGRLGNAPQAARLALAGRATADEVLRSTRYGVTFPEEAFPPRPRVHQEYTSDRDSGYLFARELTISVGVLLYNRVDLVQKLHERLEALATMFGGARIYVLAGDSTDGTGDAVGQWCRESPTVFRWVAPVNTPLRGVQRIALLRNTLLDAIEKDIRSDFVVMLDGDLEGPLSHDGVAHTVAQLVRDSSLSCVAAFGVNNWLGIDTCFPFVGYTYYDPFAFREADWERTDSDAAIRWRLGFQRRGDPLLEVRSAFAGCAIYRSSSIRGLRYDVSTIDCEHVGFHRALAERGGRLCINPAMLLLAGRQGHHENE